MNEEEEEYPATVFDFMGFDPNDDKIRHKDCAIDIFFLQGACAGFSAYCAVLAAIGAILCLIL